MATTTKPRKKRLTKAEREAQAEARRKLVNSLYGKYANMGGPTVQDVIDERRWEVEKEEREYKEHLRLAGTGRPVK